MANGSDSAPNLHKPLPADARRIPIPAVALGPWLAEIDDPVELKVTLRVLALLAEGSNRRGAPPSVSLDDLVDDGFLAAAVGADSVNVGLAAAVARGTLVACFDRGEVRVFLNDEHGQRYFERADVRLVAPEHIAGSGDAEVIIHDAPADWADAGRANIFALYEEHMGPFGHSVAEQLKAAESEYPLRWIEEAFAVAAERNAANWNYIHAILRRWVQEGRYAGLSETNGQRRDQHNEHGKPGHDTAPDSRTGYLDSYRRRYGRLPWESGEPDAG